ncbi:MAG: NAD(P)H-dependent oxidoreductase [Pseudomonadota bacterium]
MTDTSEVSSVKALLLFAHPLPNRSRANRAMLRALDGLEGLMVRDLYELYADFHIDVGQEQRLLRQAELIIFQHPIYWYSAPAILKQWMDSVLLPGFAFGSGERALQDKRLMSAVSAGHSERSYTQGGYDSWTMEEFLRPFEQTARHCGMDYLSPFVLYDAQKMDERQLIERAKEYRRTIEVLLNNQTPEEPHGN